ncbi:hypothetical protein BVL40_04800 [Corynebacterium diphtheriae]|nr:hypothetical protein BVL37_05000 [Corynebacterium diphtheriae]OWN43614.1 hypothetical protein AY507_07360 [Corynebacterium diphtheriae bv. mitis]OMO48535.1 hypothetical protein BVL40_04800 [Corynebacterium diphtheriae]OWM42930.1 hypothetical protein BU164_10535 [Corynebacterium diphtheriae]OWM48287.1 hypothetical protein BU163_09625 [Corynebacterium diphtheriae]
MSIKNKALGLLPRCMAGAGDLGIICVVALWRCWSAPASMVMLSTRMVVIPRVAILAVRWWGD